MTDAAAPSNVRVAAIQHDIVWADRDANFEHIAPMIKSAAGSGARLALLTETFSTGFVTDRSIGEPEGGPSSQFIVDRDGTRTPEHAHVVLVVPPVQPVDSLVARLLLGLGRAVSDVAKVRVVPVACSVSRSCSVCFV